MSILTTILGGISLGKGIYDTFKKDSTSTDKFGDSLGVLNKYSGLLDNILGSGNSSPDYEYMASIQNQLNEKSVQQQLRANKELANYQFQLNKSQVDNQNFYNSPEQQMHRLKDAGLNPALMYGNGVTASATGNQTETAKYSAPQAEKVDYISSKMLELQMLKMYQDVRLTQAQVEGQDIANEGAASANRVAMGTEDARIYAQNLSNQLTEGEITLKEALANTENAKQTLTNNQANVAAAQLGLIAEQINKAKQDVESMKLSNEESRRTLEDRISLIANQVEESGINIDILKKEYDNLLRFGQRNDPRWQIISAASAGLGASVLNNTIGLVKNFWSNLLKGRGSKPTD